MGGSGGSLPILRGLAAVENVATDLETTSATRTTKKPSIDVATLEQYQEFLRLYWELDYTSSAQESIDDIERWIRHLRSIVPNAGGSQQLVIELMCRYHQLATWIARDQRDYVTAFTHAHRAVELACWTENSELIAAALFRRGRTSLEQGNIGAAITDLDAALPHAHRARPQLKGLVLLAAGHAHAHAPDITSTDAMYARTLLDQAGRIVRRGHLEEDESFVKLNTGRFHLDKAGALIAVGQHNEALDELDLAARGVGPEQTRRHAYINVLRTQAYVGMGDFEIATTIAEDALSVSKGIKSAINIARIEELCEQISNSKYGNAPQAERLKLKLASPGSKPF